MLPSLIYDKIIDGNYKQFLDKDLANCIDSLPAESHLKSILKQSFVINRPMNKVGGDGYWLYDNGQEFFLVVFDCMGHGPLANIMTRKYVKVIETVVKKEKFSYPSVILEQIHHHIAQEFGNIGDDRVGSGADMGVVSYKPSSRKLQYAGAKMDLAQISDGQISLQKGDKLQVGEIFDRNHVYNTTEMKLPKSSSTFFLYSDGATDLMGGEKNKKMGKKRLINILERSYFLPVEEARSYIEKQLNLWMGDNMQIDDILLIGFTI